MRNTLQPHELICVVCNKPIQGKYVYDEWGNKAHVTHKINFCNSCNRIISQRSSGGGVQHPDGRTICRRCYADSVRTDPQVKKAYTYVVRLLKKAGFNGFPDNINLRLVNKPELAKLSGETDSLGLAHVVKRKSVFGQKIISCTIYVLDYLPEIYFEAILAHELLHTWVAGHNIRLGKYEEALCNIGSTLVYNANKNHYLSHYLNEKMKTNQDPDYGIRFMELKSRLKQKGWQLFVDEIKRTG